MSRLNEYRREFIVNVCAIVVFSVILTWVIMFKCNLLTNDLRFGYRSANFVPFRGIAEGTFWVECLLNALAFMPLGYLIAAISREGKLLIATIVSFVLAAFYEALQYFMAFGSLDITDAVCNGVGGVMGALSYLLVGKRLIVKGMNAISLAVALIGLPVSIYAVITTVKIFSIYII